MMGPSLLAMAVGLLGLSPAHAATECRITAGDCPTMRESHMRTFSDSLESSASDETGCLQRADEMKNWCRTSQSVTASYLRDGKPIRTRTAAGFIPPSSATVNFYVDSQTGSDNNSGTSGAPFLTIARAQTAVQTAKNMKNSSGLYPNITVWLRGGFYIRPTTNLNQPFLSFTAMDSGNPNPPGNPPQLISWAAYVNPSTGKAETPVITGAQAITSFSPAFTLGPGGPQIYQAAAGSTQFRQLYVVQIDPTFRTLTNQIKLARARFPAAGTADFELTIPIPSSYTRGSSGLGAFVPGGGDASWMSGQTMNQLNQTEVVMRKTFGMTRLQLNFAGAFDGQTAVGIFNQGNTSGNSQIDLEVCGTLAMYAANPAAVCGTGSGQFFGPSYQDFSPVASGTINSAFHYENNIDFIQTPGDWYEDVKTNVGTTYVYPPAGITLPTNGNLNTTGIIAPQGVNPGDNEVLLSVGTPTTSGCTSNNTVSNVQFVGLTFSHSNWLYPNANGFVGFDFPQYRSSFSTSSGSPVEVNGYAPAAVTLGCTNGVTFAENLFSQLGANGISDTNPAKLFLVASGTNSGVSQNLVLYGNAFTQIAGDGIALGEGYGTITIASNLFAGVGQDYGGSAIFVAAPQSVSITHNDARFVASRGILVSDKPFMPSTTTTWWNIEENVVSNTGLDYNDIGGINIADVNDGFSLPFTNFSSGSPPAKVAVAWNELNAITQPTWYPSSTSLTPIGIYLDFYTEGTSVEDNYLNNTSASFHLNCESNNLITNNIVTLNTAFAPCAGGNFVSPPAPFTEPSPIPSASNNPNVTLHFPTPPGLTSDVAPLWTNLTNNLYPTNTPAAPM